MLSLVAFIDSIGAPAVPCRAAPPRARGRLGKKIP
jgi:hypothetical protein